MKPQIVLVVSDKEKNSQVVVHKPDMLELRIDLFKSISVDYAVAQFKERKKLKIPLLLTVRNQTKEGAKKEFPDAKKWELLEALMPFCSWVDIELSSPLCNKAVLLARKLKKKVVISAHDFKRMPAHPENLMKKALSIRADAFKLAAFANKPQDLIQMLEFTKKNNKHFLVTMCMGELGGLSRVLLPFAGSRWVYTFLSKPTAPGQLDIKTIQAILSIP